MQQSQHDQLTNVENPPPNGIRYLDFGPEQLQGILDGCLPLPICGFVFGSTDMKWIIGTFSRSIDKWLRPSG